MDKKIPLIPCPFCGIAPGGVQELRQGGFNVGCMCGACGPVAENEDDAREAWNQRAVQHDKSVPARCYSKRPCNHIVRCGETKEVLKDIRAKFGCGTPARLPTQAAADGAAQWMSELTGLPWEVKEVRS